MTARLDKWSRVLERLRLVDSVIDIARGHVQLSLLMLLAERGKIVPDTASETLGISRKSVVDGLQKLKKKGLVVRGAGRTYTLTEEGKKLAELLEGVVADLSPSDTLEELVEAYQLGEAVLLAGTSTREWVDLGELARRLEVGEKRLLKLIESRGREIFKVREMGGKIQVALTYEGSQLYDMLLNNMKMGPLTARILSLLTGTLDPRDALRRFLVVYLLISVLVFVELTSPMGVIPGAIWAAASLYIAFLLYSKK